MAIWEFAPGSPWNAIFMVLVLLWSLSHGALYQPLSFSPVAWRVGYEVGRGVDAARHGVDDGDVDPHAGLERPQLLELLLPLQG